MAKVTGKYFPKSRLSIVTINDKHGFFTGTASCHPEDTPNEITGCTIAERRATKKRLKARCNNLRIKINTLKSFEKEIINYDSEYKDHPIINRLHITIKAYKNELDETLSTIENLKNQEKIDKKIREKIRSKKSK